MEGTGMEGTGKKYLGKYEIHQLSFKKNGNIMLP